MLILFHFSYQVVKILNATDEHVMALGANFSLQAASHLVCIQSEQGYKTQAINIQNQPRKGIALTQNSSYTRQCFSATCSAMLMRAIMRKVADESVYVQYTPSSQLAL